MATLTSAPETLFWYWIAERHAIHLRRFRGEPKPWTTDPILRDYKFTNPFRENDRGTVWLRENFLEPHRDDDLGLIAFNICWYRMFNWTGTGQYFGWIKEWDAYTVREELSQRLNKGHQVFTGAHIVYSRPGLTKIDAIVKVCSDLYALCTRPSNMAAPNVVDVARSEKTLESVYNLLKTVDSVGGFMAYEMVCDMYHTPLLEDATDIMTWGNPGPGAKRGLQRLGLTFRPDAYAINSMGQLLKAAVAGISALGVTMSADTWPVIELRDIEHSLCEFDKYCRVKFGEGQPRSKYPGAT